MTKKQITPAKPKEPTVKLMSRARMAVHPRTNGAAVIQEYCKPFGEQDFVELMTVMAETSSKVLDGDMKPVESMLFAQAQALQSMFMNFSRKAINADYQPRLESYFRMALKAQNQCRMTLETLANIKNPPVVFAKQANIAHGHQQVNNGIPDHAPEEKAFQSNEQLEHQHGKWMDTGTTRTASGLNQELETVGKVHGRKD